MKTSNKRRSQKTTNTKPSKDKGHRGGADRWIDDLVEQWNARRLGDLQLRHATGAAINQKIAESPDRKEYGTRLVEKLARRLGLSVSEVSRLRAFARKFPSFDAFREGHPDTRTWTVLKKLLPTIPEPGAESKPAGKRKTPGRKKQSPQQRRNARALAGLQGLVKRLSGLGKVAQTDERREQWRQAFAALSEAVPPTVGVRLVVQLDP